MEESEMGIYLSDNELTQVEPAENAFRSPVPTQIVSNGEFNPLPQTRQQKQVEARIKELADQHGAKQGLNRREFLCTSCGMAAAFAAMNSVFGNLFDVSEAEAADPAQAAAFAASEAGAERRALRAAIVQKVGQGALTVVDALAASEIKTRAAVEMLRTLGAGGKTLLVDVTPDEKLALAVRNLAGVRLVPSNRVTARDVADAARVIATRDAVERLQEALS